MTGLQKAHTLIASLVAAGMGAAPALATAHPAHTTQITHEGLATEYTSPQTDVTNSNIPNSNTERHGLSRAMFFQGDYVLPN